MGKKKKTSESTSTPPAPSRQPASESAPPPISSAPLPLLDLSPGDLGAFFELCFPDKRLLALCHELKLHTPGYRLEALPPDQVARVLADEYLAAKDVRPLLDGAVREVLRDPVLESREVSAADLGQLLDLVVAGDPLQHLARIAWRALLTPGEPERRMALEAIDEGVRALDAPAQQKKPPRKAPPPGQKEAEEAVKRAERAEREREAMKQQLAQARGEISSREQRLAEQKTELTQARSEVSRLSAEVARLSAAGEGRALADARRYADEARALAEKLRGAEEAREAAEDRVSQVERRLAQAPQVAMPQPSGEADLPSEEEASTFLVPVLTREFYDSIERWDRRMQRAAFDKIHRLANDWRHGSLRALALEGVPGYYRIRVATAADRFTGAVPEALGRQQAGGARRPPAAGSAGRGDHRRLAAHPDERDPRPPRRGPAPGRARRRLQARPAFLERRPVAAAARLRRLQPVRRPRRVARAGSSHRAIVRVRRADRVVEAGPRRARGGEVRPAGLYSSYMSGPEECPPLRGHSAVKLGARPDPSSVRGPIYAEIDGPRHRARSRRGGAPPHPPSDLRLGGRDGRARRGAHRGARGAVPAPAGRRAGGRRVPLRAREAARAARAGCARCGVALRSAGRGPRVGAPRVRDHPAAVHARVHLVRAG